VVPNYIKLLLMLPSDDVYSSFETRGINVHLQEALVQLPVCQVTPECAVQRESDVAIIQPIQHQLVGLDDGADNLAELSHRSGEHPVNASSKAVKN
jgi:hypothetical protein